MDSKFGWKSAAAFAAGGAALGAALGLLFAPKSGKELREDLKVYAKKTEEKGKTFYAKVRQMIPKYIRHNGPVERETAGV